MAELAFRDVRKTYAGLEVIHGVTTDVTDGEFVVIVGPSGCGKSTLLRMVAGLEQITSGEIRIGSRVVNNLEPKDRDIAMVFQNYALYPHMSVYENMSYGLRIKGFSRQEIDSRVQKAAAILELKPFLERRPRQLSGGQRQRVAMGRAIVRQPQAFLMDEPLSNLDAQLRAEMRLEIRALQRKLGITMVYVTHDQVEAMSMADRVVLMRAGRIEQNGTPVELYENPANTFVARFIGTPPMNLLRLVAARGGAIIAGTEGPVVLGGRFASGQLGVRPEHMQLAFETGVRAGVDSVEYLGGDSLVSCRVGDQPVAVRVAGSVGLARGDATWIRWAPGAQHYFDDAGLRTPIEARDEPVTLIA